MMISLQNKDIMPRNLQIEYNELYCPPQYASNYLEERYAELQNRLFSPFPISMFSQGCQTDCPYQDFDYFVVIDFEATCDKGKPPYPQEIIEFPSVLVNGATGELEASFQKYVRPTCNKVLTEFCKELTGIQQAQVDEGVTLSEALLGHDLWLEKNGIKNTTFAIVTWSDWDCEVMLESECRIKNIPKPIYFNRWINLKVPFREVFGTAKCNLKQAVERAGLTWEGRAHCGLDDANNTARLLALILHKGFKLSFTKGITCNQTSDDNDATCAGMQELNGVPISLVPSCYCGVKAGVGVDPSMGSVFFGCGNWTAAEGPRCHYFDWLSS